MQLLVVRESGGTPWALLGWVSILHHFDVLKSPEELIAVGVYRKY